MRAFILTQVLIGILLVSTIGGVFAYMTSRSKPNSYSQTGPVTSKPVSLTLNLDSPDDDLLVFSSSIVISGKTTPNLNVLVSTLDDDFVILSKEDGTFSGDLDLKLGQNEVTVVVFDNNGDQRETKRTIYYSKEKI